MGLGAMSSILNGCKMRMVGPFDLVVIAILEFVWCGGIFYLMWVVVEC